MKVAINAQLVSFGQSYRNAGVSRYTYQLLDGLSHLHNDQQYLAFINPADAAAATTSPLGQSERLTLTPSKWSTPNPARRIAWEQLALPGDLRRLGADVFHSPINVLPRATPCPSVVSVMDMAFMHYPHYFRPARRYYQRIFTQRSVRQASLVVAISESTKRDVTQFCDVAPEKVHVIYPALFPGFEAPPTAEAVQAFRDRRQAPSDYLLYLGTLEPRKNLDTLLTAYAQLRQLEPDAPPLVLAGGKGWYFQTLFERVRVLGLENHITFVGYVSREEQALWYAGATVFIYPSLFEGFGLPIIEALACGTPTITSNVSSMPEAAGSVALQVTPTDAGALACAMQRLLRDDEKRAVMKREGPRWANQFSIERMANAYARIYEMAATAK